MRGRSRGKKVRGRRSERLTDARKGREKDMQGRGD